LRKLYLVALLGTMLAVGAVLGAFVTRYVWQTTMTMRLTGALTYEVEIRHLNGTPITNYNWGDFAYEEEKYLSVNIVYLGNASDAYVYWNTTGLPSGWSVQIWDFLYGWDWAPDTTSYFTTDEIRLLAIYLTAPASGQLNVPLGFILNFVSGEETA